MPLAQVQKELGMQEGFDVGLEMSGHASALREMIANMSHGAKIAMLGIPTQEIAIDWTTVVFNMLTIKGIYGREMYETWYKMSVMLEIGAGYPAGDYAPVFLSRLREGVRSNAVRQFGQSDSRMVVNLGGRCRVYEVGDSP